MKSKILLIGATAALLSALRERLPDEEVEAISAEEAERQGFSKPIELTFKNHLLDFDLRQLGRMIPPEESRFKGYQSGRRRH